MNQYLPIYEITRGDIVESVHFGAFAIVDSHGNLVAWHGDPFTTTYLRSTSKPLQALPFIEAGGAEKFQLSGEEIAILCASHSGTDEHVRVIKSIQRKTGITENDLLCGVHPPFHKSTEEAMQLRGEEPTPNRHNCSGKHSGMLALAIMLDAPISDYVNPTHPVQEIILNTFAAMCDLPAESIHVGIDGCSAPNFAVPLYNAALAFARLCDPSTLPPPRAEACRKITLAMTSHPEMVAGAERFDTKLMESTQGRILVKGGAEGYQGIGLFPGTLHPDAPAFGIALKISDGDLKSRVRPAVTLEILRRINALTETELVALKNFGPSAPVHNWRKHVVGEARPNFEMQWNNRGSTKANGITICSGQR